MIIRARQQLAGVRKLTNKKIDVSGSSQLDVSPAGPAFWLLLPAISE